jgi:lipoprotein-anchoring transpeptidase ErfK/SrfK
MRRGRLWCVRKPVVMVALVLVVGGVLLGTGPAQASTYHLDIDISEQVLSEVVDGQAVATYHVSSGSGEDYWSQGILWDGETPQGWFEIYAKDPGWVEAPLGWLYNAMYFYEGYAIHGSGSVPDYPASHGCARVSVSDADWLYARIGIGTPVHVHD